MVQLRLIGLAVAILSLAGVSNTKESSGQDCAALCWENSKFISGCGNITECFCDDAEYQTAVFQCIYVQCPTALFGPALHHALAMCSADPTTSRAPALIRQEKLRKREDNFSGYNSASRSAYATASRSVHYKSASASATRSSHPIQSAHRGSSYASVSRSALYGKRAMPTPF